MLVYGVTLYCQSVNIRKNKNINNKGSTWECHHVYTSDSISMGHRLLSFLYYNWILNTSSVLQLGISLPAQQKLLLGKNLASHICSEY